jgi:hypothetical protein
MTSARGRARARGPHRRAPVEHEARAERVAEPPELVAVVDELPRNPVSDDATTSGARIARRSSRSPSGTSVR